MKEIDSEAWERLQEVIRFSHSRNIADFARKLGTVSPAVLYQIKSGNNDISKKLAIRIYELYPEFTVPWLMLGINEEAVTSIPLYSHLGNYIAKEPYRRVRLAINIASEECFGINITDCKFARHLEGTTVLFEPVKEIPPYREKPLCVMELKNGQVRFGSPEYLITKYRFQTYEKGRLSRQKIGMDEIREIFIMSVAFRKFDYGF